ncbi:MAG: c-type cytochrome biogenesis protein CcmI [Acidobacteriota bacterium]
MLSFWIICTLLVLLALWFVLPAFLDTKQEAGADDQRRANLAVYQDQYQELEADLKHGLIEQEEYQQEKDELERRLLDDVQKQSVDSAPVASPAARKFGYGVAAAIPIVAVAFYFLVGNPRALTPGAISTAAPGAATRPGEMRSQQQIEENVNKLAQRLQQNPNDAEGWVMLARSYMMLERYSDAADAYGRAIALNDKDANLWTDFAEALAMANQRRLTGKPTEALTRALQLDPKNQKALDLFGSAAYQAGDYQKAIETWQKLLRDLPPGSEEVRTISDQIAKAKELVNAKGSR